MIAAPLIAVGIGVCGFVAGFMTKLMSPNHHEEDEKQLKEIEHKLDVLQEQLHQLLESQKQSFAETRLAEENENH